MKIPLIILFSLHFFPQNVTFHGKYNCVTGNSRCNFRAGVSLNIHNLLFTMINNSSWLEKY